MKEAILQVWKTVPSLTPDDVLRCIDDITTRLHDEAAEDLTSFLFDESFATS